MNTLMRQQMPAAFIASKTGQSLRSAQRHYSTFKSTAICGTEAPVRFKRPGPEKKDIRDLENFIDSIVRGDNSLTLQGMFNFFFSYIFDIGINSFLPEHLRTTESVISRVLKGLGYTRKRLVRVPAGRNSDVTIDARHHYCRIASRIRNDQFIFIDETGFNLHTSRTYGWALPSNNAILTVPSNRARNISVLTAVTVSGIVAFHIQRGSITREVLLRFMDEQLLQVTSRMDCPVLVMDNARAHHGDDVIAWQTTNNLRLEYLPAYSPQLNPIENLFGVIKSQFHNIRPRVETVVDLEGRLRDLFGGFRTYSMDSFFVQMRSYVEKGLNRELFL